MKGLLGSHTNWGALHRQWYPDKREEHTDVHRRISGPRSSEMAAIAGSRSQILPANGSLRGLEEVLELDCEELRRLAISAHKTAAEVIQRQRA